MAAEIELKLLAEPSFDEAALLQRVAELGSLGDAQRFEQTDTYLDTAAGHLRAAGLSARMRQRTGGRTVDVKAVPIDADLVMRRLELSCTVGPEAFVSDALRHLLQSELGMAVSDAFVPCLQLVTDRTVRVLEAEGSEVELCVDRVRVLGTDQVDAGGFTEVEAELASGDDAVLHRLATALAGDALTPSGQSKYIRGRAVAGLTAYAYGAPSPAVTGDMPVAALARAVGRQQVAIMRSYEPGTRLGVDTEHLHKMRVASRRLRTALVVFEAAFGDEERDVLARELRFIGRRLGAVRDLDVHTLAQSRWRATLGPQPRAGWDALAERLAARRARAQSRLLDALDGPRWAALLERADTAFASTEAAGPTVGESAPALLAEPIAAFDAGVAKFRTTHAVEDAHRLRILGKRVRYTAEFLKPLLRDSARAAVKRLSVFQDALGELQDAIAAGEFAVAQAKPRWSSPPGLVFVLGALAGSARTLTALARSRVDAALLALGSERGSPLADLSSSQALELE